MRTQIESSDLKKEIVMEVDQKSSLSLREILYICFKRKYQIFIFFIATFCTVAIGTFWVKPVYLAETQIMVKVGRENIYVPATGDLRPFFSNDHLEKLNSAIEMLKSPSIIEKTILTLGPTVIYEDFKEEKQQGLSAVIRNFKAKIKHLLAADREPHVLMDAGERNLKEATLRFAKHLKIEGIKNSNLINIGFKHHNPALAAVVVNTLTESYMEHYLNVHKTEQSDDFYQRQVDFLKNKLRRKEGDLEALKVRNNITSLDEQQELLLTKAADLRSDLNNTLSQETETRNRIKELQRQLTRIPETIPQAAEAADNPYLINTLETRLVELQLEEKKLLTKYTDESRLVRNVRDEIQVVKNKLDEQEVKKYESSRTGINATHQELHTALLSNQAELKALEAKAFTQKSQLKEYQVELENLSQNETQYKNLVQEIELDRKTYQNYLEKLENSRISEAMDAAKIASVRLIEPAKPPLEPASPKKKLNLMIAIVFGIFGGLGLAFFMEYLNNKLERPEDIENFLNVPVLTSIPKL
jgi:uncharacterized protein involved in exopolysaccharide biosynthesis